MVTVHGGIFSLHSRVCVTGIFNGLAAVAFLPPPRSPAKKTAGAAVSPTANPLKIRSAYDDDVPRKHAPVNGYESGNGLGGVGRQDNGCKHEKIGCHGYALVYRCHGGGL